MKNSKYSIFCAWILLICFVAGQYMVYAHQHTILRENGIAFSTPKNQPKPAVTVQEKCYMCDAMHNTAMVVTHQVYFNPIVVTGHTFKVGDYNFVSIALILSAGRAPPVMVYSC